MAASTSIRTLDPMAPVTRRALGVELLGPMAGSAFREPPALVRRADGQTISVTPLLAAVLDALDGERTHLEVAWEVARTTDRVLSAGEVGYLIDEKLRPLGLVVDGDDAEPEVERSNPLLALRLRFVVSNPRITNAVTRPFAALFRPWVVAPVVLAFAVVSAWVLFGKGVGSGLHEAFYEPELLLLVVALTVASSAFHEFGHAAACRYSGATPGAMGAGLYLVWPAFYTDVSDSYRLDRRGRLRVDLGGLYFNTIFALGTFAAWLLIDWDALLLVIPLQLFQMVRQLLPLVRFDGYHILADVTGVPDLFARIRPTIAGLLPANWGKPEHRVLRPWARAIVTAWVLVVVPALALFFVALLLGLPRLFATAGASLRLQHSALQEAFIDGDALAAMARLVSMFAIALPPLSSAYLLTRLARRTWSRIWRAAGALRYGRPVAAVALAGLAGFAAFALWPGEQYEPIRPDERLTVGDGFGLRHSPIVAMTGDVVDRLAPPAAGASDRTRLDAARPRGTGAVDDAERLRLPAGGSVAEAELLATPASSPAAGAREAWPFPFAPPPTPRPQDNFSVAVNPVDGERVAVMETSMHWLGEARVDHRNRAYALASCADCTTVAAAFQVVVASGTSRTVVPENSAIAVNYECTTCVTHAIAVQAVVTTTSTPPAAVRAQVEARVARARALEARVASIPTAELRAQLHAIEAEVLDLLAPYTKKVRGGEATDEADPAASTDATPSTVPTSSTTTSPGPSSTTTTEVGASSPSSTTSTSPSSTTSSTSTSTTSSSSTTTSTTTTSTTAPPEPAGEEASPGG